MDGATPDGGGGARGFAVNVITHASLVYQLYSICVWRFLVGEFEDNDNECFILTYELIKQIIYSTMIDQYSHSQGNHIMTYISLACNYQKICLKICVLINSLCF